MRAFPPGRIAFDLDDTLISCDLDFPLEPQQGEAHGFRVIRVDLRSETWVDEVLSPLGLQP
jgi:hypothetical protein